MTLRKKNRRRQGGQAVLEYILLVVMLAVTMASVIRTSSRSIYGFWTGLARQVASPCSNCNVPPAPDLAGGTGNGISPN